MHVRSTPAPQTPRGRVSQSERLSAPRVGQHPHSTPKGPPRGSQRPSRAASAAAAAELSLVSVNQLETINPTQPTTQPPTWHQSKEGEEVTFRLSQEGRARTTRMSLSAPTRSGDQVSTGARYVTSQRAISSSMPSWTSWAEGQGDDQGLTARRSERSEGRNISSSNR